jgi:hypothetical protein
VTDNKRAADDAEREAFEAWVSASGREHMLERDHPHLWYKDLTVSAWWTAWQARAALSARADGGKDSSDAERYRKWVSYSGFTKEHCDETLDAIQVNENAAIAKEKK